jgi:hypothetical protein
LFSILLSELCPLITVILPCIIPSSLWIPFFPFDPVDRSATIRASVREMTRFPTAITDSRCRSGVRVGIQVCVRVLIWISGYIPVALGCLAAAAASFFVLIHYACLAVVATLVSGIKRRFWIASTKP